MNTHGCLDCRTTFTAAPTAGFATCPACGANAGVQIVDVAEIPELPQSDAPVPAFQVRGLTDEVTTCELCGRNELRGTVQLLELDADGNPVRDHYYGTGCAATAAGWTQNDLKDRVRAAQTARREAAAKQRAADHAHEMQFLSQWYQTHYGTPDVHAAAKLAGTSAARLSDRALDAYRAAAA